MSIIAAFFRFVVMVLVFVSCAAPLVADIPAEEREALIAFYNATNGDEWKDNAGWKAEPLEDDGFAAYGTGGEWFGITVSNDHVTKIEMRDNGLNGTLPPELANLNHLEHLFIMGEWELTGGIPPGLGSLVNLVTLDIIRTELTGTIPPELGNLVNLRVLRLCNNMLSGSIPPELGNLDNLQTLDLSSGAFQIKNLKIKDIFPKKVPGKSEREKMKEFADNLEALGVRNWQFSGTIPAELGNLVNLESLNLNGNRLSGAVPAALGNLTRLKTLSISSNRLSGPVPFELGNLSRLEKLGLGSNRLSGPMPGELGNLSQLEDLDLRGNRLTGRIPPELGNLANLRYLQLMNNRLSGSIPMELGNIHTLQQLRLQGNRLSGLIPPNLAASPAYLVELRYNALYTDNGLLKTYLDKRDSRWADTQTAAPTSVTVVAVSPGSVKVSWTPIVYKADAGGYTIFYGNSAAGPWTEAGTTADKKTKSFVVTGLTPGKKYYFTVQTRTEPNGDNQNTVISELSPAARGFFPRGPLRGSIFPGGERVWQGRPRFPVFHRNPTRPGAGGMS